MQLKYPPSPSLIASLLFVGVLAACGSKAASETPPTLPAPAPLAASLPPAVLAHEAYGVERGRGFHAMSGPAAEAVRLALSVSDPGTADQIAPE